MSVGVFPFMLQLLVYVGKSTKIIRVSSVPSTTTILAKRFWDTSPFSLGFCMEFAANLQYTLINTALTRFCPHPPKQS